MSFLAPYFLIGLGALLVPVIIHMWSKDARQSVAFGSLRFLKETETRTTRSIMPSQWLLLLIRLLLLTLLVFLLAEMHLPSEAKKSPRMYVVDQFYQDSELVAKLVDTVAEGVEVRWLAEGFPDIRQPISAKLSNYWNLLGNLPSAAECVVVVSPLHQKYFIGKRRTIPSVCQWIKPPVDPQQEELARIEKNGNTYSILAEFDEWTTKISFAEAEAEAETPIEVSYYLKVEEGYEKLGSIMDAAITSIQKVSRVTLNEVTDPDQADWVLWLSNSAQPEKAPLIRVDNNVLNWTSLGNRTYLMPTNLTMEDAIRVELPRLILSAFMDNYFAEEANDLLTVDTNVFDYASGDARKLNTTKDASSFLWIALLLMLLLERWLSYKSNAVAV